MDKIDKDRLQNDNSEVRLTVDSCPVTLRFTNSPNMNLARQIKQTLLDTYIKNKSEELEKNVALSERM